MNTLPKSIQKELISLRKIDSAPYTFFADKIDFCNKLYSTDYKKLGKFDVFRIMHNFPELIDYRHLTDVQYDLLQEQYTFALESL